VFSHPAGRAPRRPANLQEGCAPRLRPPRAARRQ
jgi:hypothetical protein